MTSRHDRKRRYSDEPEDHDRRRSNKDYDRKHNERKHHERNHHERNHHERNHNNRNHDEINHHERNQNERNHDERNHHDRNHHERKHQDRKFHEKKHYEWGKNDNSPPKVVKEKEKPNFQTTGKLAEETNTYRGVVIKYSEPPEARVPVKRWRFYPFKGEQALPVFYMHRQSGYLIGRDRKIADFAIDHPSCSKQHAVFQFRMIAKKNDIGQTVESIRPYIIDLGSANGTHLNGKRIEPQKYYEMFERDVLKFGYSSREYVLLHENSGDAAEDDVVVKDEDDV